MNEAIHRALLYELLKSELGVLEQVAIGGLLPKIWYVDRHGQTPLEVP
jgi:hypothetical protein